MNEEQRSIDVSWARVLARMSLKSGDAGDGAQGPAARDLKVARLQSLYLESDASPNKDMLRHYWRGFTNRPPSRLPAFGMAQSVSDLERHVAAAKRAVVRDCGGKADCQWMHALDGKHSDDGRRPSSPGASARACEDARPAPVGRR